MYGQTENTFQELAEEPASALAPGGALGRRDGGRRRRLVEGRIETASKKGFDAANKIEVSDRSDLSYKS